MSQKRSIALVTYMESPQLTTSDEMLQKSLNKLGMSVSPQPWDDRNTNWELFDAVVLRSCWDYHTRPTEFIDWINRLKDRAVMLINDYELVLWNTHKAYMLELENKGIKIVPTIYLRKGSEINSSAFADIESDNIVVKPAIGASAYEIFSGAVSDKNILKKLELFVDKQDMLVQPMMKEISEVGEYSSVFFNKSYSHTVLKKPKHGDFRSNYEQGGTSELFEQSKEIVSQIEKTIRVMPSTPLYSRIDYVLRGDVVFLMELELIEPSLYLNLYPPAAETFAKEIISQINASSLLPRRLS